MSRENITRLSISLLVSIFVAILSVYSLGLFFLIRPLALLVVAPIIGLISFLLIELELVALGNLRLIPGLFIFCILGVMGGALVSWFAFTAYYTSLRYFYPLTYIGVERSFLLMLAGIGCGLVTNIALFVQYYLITYSFRQQPKLTSNKQNLDIDNHPQEDELVSVELAELYLVQGHLKDGKRMLDAILAEQKDNQQALELLRRYFDADKK